MRRRAGGAATNSTLAARVPTLENKILRWNLDSRTNKRHLTGESNRDSDAFCARDKNIIFDQDKNIKNESNLEWRLQEVPFSKQIFRWFLLANHFFKTRMRRTVL